MMRSYAGWLASVMHATGVKGKDIAEELGIAQYRVSLWKSGKTIPTYNTAIEIATILGVHDFTRMEEALKDAVYSNYRKRGVNGKRSKKDEDGIQ